MTDKLDKELLQAAEEVRRRRSVVLFAGRRDGSLQARYPGTTTLVPVSAAEVDALRTMATAGEIELTAPVIPLAHRPRGSRVL